MFSTLASIKTRRKRLDLMKNHVILRFSHQILLCEIKAFWIFLCSSKLARMERSRTEVFKLNIKNVRGREIQDTASLFTGN